MFVSSNTVFNYEYEVLYLSALNSEELCQLFFFIYIYVCIVSFVNKVVDLPRL